MPDNEKFDIKALLAQDSDPEEEARLQKYKEEMGVVGEGGGTISQLTLTLEVEGDRPSQTWHLDSPETLAEIKTKAFVLAEGCHYRIVIGFRVDGSKSVLGLKCTSNTYRKGVRVLKDARKLGSFPARKAPHSVSLPPHGWEEAPTGLLSHGHYDVKSAFHDGDNTLLAEFEYAFDIKAGWPDA
ncbi:hypothetical protein R1T08_14760 [Streptomyces sp. SBC-4]|nr:hypothetical protein [Streptomyces sp. SBC-4]MDV5145439.1 hypothetical protein [Streptomyces sp. SBC-4]